MTITNVKVCPCGVPCACSPCLCDPTTAEGVTPCPCASGGEPQRG